MEEITKIIEARIKEGNEDIADLRRRREMELNSALYIHDELTKKLKEVKTLESELDSIRRNFGSANNFKPEY